MVGNNSNGVPPSTSINLTPGIIMWGPPVEQIRQRGKLVVEQIQDSSHTYLISMLVKGGAGCGKTALAVDIARSSQFPFIKVISPENMIGYHESSKCQAIKKVNCAVLVSVSLGMCVCVCDVSMCCDYRCLMMLTSLPLAAS